MARPDKLNEVRGRLLCRLHAAALLQADGHDFPHHFPLTGERRT